MTREDFLRSLQAEPFSFLTLDDATRDDWVAAAWEIEGIREPVVADFQREVSKWGEPNCTDEFLRLLARALPPNQVCELYERLRDHSPHREAELRPQFERALGANASLLPRARTRLRLVRSLGPEQAESLLCDDLTSDGERALLRVMSRVVELFLEIDPPGFEPYCDDEFDEPVEHVISGLPACRSREGLRELVREGFYKCWVWEKLCARASAEAERKFDRLADEVWQLWSEAWRGVNPAGPGAAADGSRDAGS